MDVLLTWVEGEEVQYQFADFGSLRDFRLEPDRQYAIVELASGQLIDDIRQYCFS
ncbi:hypothetical protein [Heliophilum fasciatum]|uniref:Uncharacterized protein n=1 Tax=Heliophilum fasciatum TaxID=35700 RepID=A0A4R2RMQ0_9FIRM|nr:hypothetical protein [Heliophilum fasciatum]MCW2278076.1 hypothetical protein [Heliophilum fasciatum]TCP64304.1 hypothetical protein EDD73_1103 [Heliophilum fasciatum]